MMAKKLKGSEWYARRQEIRRMLESTARDAAANEMYEQVLCLDGQDKEFADTLFVSGVTLSSKE